MEGEEKVWNGTRKVKLAD